MGILLLCVLAAFTLLAKRHRFALSREDRKPISFSPPTIDLGEVWDGTILDRTVRVFNNSSNSIVVQDVKTDCSCTTARLGTFQLAAGSSMEMSLQFDPSTWHGARASIVQLVTDEGTFLFNTKAVARKSLEIVPAELDLGLLRAGQQIHTNLIVRHNRSNSFNPLLSKLPSGVKVELKQLDDHSWNILFDVGKDAFPSQGKEAYRVSVQNALTNYPPPVAFHISAERERNTFMHPELINFGYLTNAQPTTRTVIITNRHMGPKFAILETRASEPSIQIVQKNASNGRYTLEFSVTPSGLANRHTFEQFVTFVTNDPQDSTPQLRLIGSIVDPAQRVSCCGN